MLVCQFRHSPGWRVPSPPAYYQTPFRSSSAVTQPLRRLNERGSPRFPPESRADVSAHTLHAFVRRRRIVENRLDGTRDGVRVGGHEPTECAAACAAACAATENIARTTFIDGDNRCTTPNCLQYGEAEGLIAARMQIDARRAIDGREIGVRHEAREPHGVGHAASRRFGTQTRLVHTTTDDQPDGGGMRPADGDERLNEEIDPLARMQLIDGEEHRRTIGQVVARPNRRNLSLSRLIEVNAVRDYYRVASVCLLEALRAIITIREQRVGGMYQPSINHPIEPEQRRHHRADATEARRNIPPVTVHEAGRLIEEGE
jgi:hypothetical protein